MAELNYVEIDGKKVRLEEDKAQICGYRVYYLYRNEWRPCYVRARGVGDYFVCYFGNSTDARYRKVKKFYLHRAVYAFYMKYFRENPGNTAIHHIDENKQNNDFGNLVLMSQKNHTNYHWLKRHPSEKNDKKAKEILDKAIVERNEWYIFINGDIEK